MVTQKERLSSLDILRGFDLFMLVFFQPVFISFARHWSDVPLFNYLLGQFEHAEWIGFTAWDLVMPLFLFMVGVALPFSLDKYNSSKNKGHIYKRLIRRFIILFILGFVVQGNILNLNFKEFRIYSNTLQAIAVGYFISAIFILKLDIRKQLIATFSLIFIYWALITFLGDFTPDGNFAEKVDKVILGKFRDGVYYSEDGSWHHSDSYHYTWILTSIVFIVSTMMGVFAGRIVKNGPNKLKNSISLLIIGLSLVIGGLLLSFQTPIIKKIWSASMTLYSGGLCFVLMALFYYIIDYKGYSKGLNWLKFYGMNSITAYTLGMVISFKSIAHSVFYGLEQYIGDYYNDFLVLVNFMILFFILRLMYNLKYFVKI